MAEKPATATVEPKTAQINPPVEFEPVPWLEYTVVKSAPEPAAESPEPVKVPEPEGPVLLGTYRITAYCSCEICCGEWAKNRPGGIVYGAAMTELKPGVSCAAPSLPFGTEITVEGLGDFVVQDRPSQWVVDRFGDEQIDIYFSSHEAAEAFGLKYLNVYMKEDTTNDQMQ